jgi:hypothetical protein
MAILKTVLTAGRSYKVDDGGIDDLRETYKVILDEPMPYAQEMESFPGVPAIGSKHPKYDGCVVGDYDVTEGSDGDKIVLTVVVSYKRISSEVVTIPGEDEGQTEPTELSAEVVQWGWDSGTGEREMVQDSTGTPVLNSAGDPFDSLPHFSVPEPTFTKVMKFTDRPGSVLEYKCKVNKSPVTIGADTYPPGTLLCDISEVRDLNDKHWNYQYTVTLKYRSQFVDFDPVNTDDGSGEEIGWDVALCDAGMRECKDGVTKTLIRIRDEETGEMCTVTSAALLNGRGIAIGEDSESTVAHYLRFKPYRAVDFPDWFTSEPPLNVVNEEEEES